MPVIDHQSRIGRILEVNKELHVLPFLRIWQTADLDEEEARKLYSLLSDPAMTFENLKTFDCPSNLEDTFHAFVTFCNFDVRSETKELRRGMTSHEKWWKILCERAEGNTLEVISQSQKLTRERVRQIAARCVREFINRGGIEILGKIYAMENGPAMVDRNILKKYFSRDVDPYIYIIQQVFKNNTLERFLPFMEGCSFVYSAKLEGFLFHDRKELADDIETWLDEIPSIISEEEKDIYVQDAEKRGISKEMADLYIRDNYDLDGKVWKCGKIRVHNICSGIMKEYYEGGIYIYDPHALQEFRNRAVEKYGTSVLLPERDHALTAVISRVGMLRGRGIYIPARHGVLPEEILEEIRNYLLASTNQSCMFNTLFSVFRDKITPYGVDNRFYLQGVLKLDLGKEYTFTRDYVSCSGKVVKIQDMVLSEVAKYKEPVTKETIAKEFPGVPDIAISYALMDPRIMNYFGKYLHKDNLNMTDADVQTLRSELNDLLKDGKAHSSHELMERMEKKDPDMLRRMFVDTQFAMFSLAQIYCGDEYVMDRPQMAMHGSSGEKDIQIKRENEIKGRKARENTPRVREMATFDTIVESLKEYGTKGTTLNHLHARYHITRQQLTIMLQEPNVISLHNRIIHEDVLKGWPEAKDAFYDIIKELLDEYGVLRIHMLFELCLEKMGPFFEANDMMNEDDVFYLARHLFDKVHYRGANWYFHLHNQSISDRELEEDISFYGQVTDYFRRNQRPISFDELRERYVFLGYKINSLKYNMRLCEYPNFYIYKPDLYILAEQMPVTDEWLRTIGEKVLTLFPEGVTVMPYRALTEEWLQANLPKPPMEGIEWTMLLFQQMCIFYHDKMGVRTIRPFGIYDYNIVHSFIVTEASGIDSLSEATWVWLCDHGYRGKHMKIDALKELMLENRIVSTTVQDSMRQFATGMNDAKRFRWDENNKSVLVRR